MKCKVVFALALLIIMPWMSNAQQDDKKFSLFDFIYLYKHTTDEGTERLKEFNIDFKKQEVIKDSIDRVTWSLNGADLEDASIYIAKNCLEGSCGLVILLTTDRDLYNNLSSQIDELFENEGTEIGISDEYDLDATYHYNVHYSLFVDVLDYHDDRPTLYKLALMKRLD